MMQHASLADAALLAIGRTIVKFQRLEHYLKRASMLRPLEGTLMKFQDEMQKRRARSATLTLGGAIQAWLSAADGKLTENGLTNDLFDVTMQVAFSFFPDAESLNAHGAALKSLLETRNSMVHDRFVNVQWDSPEECQRLIAKLDAVNQDIDRQLNFLTSILGAVKTLGAIRTEDLELLLAEPTSQTATEP